METAGNAEEEAGQAYEDVLSQNYLPLPVRQLLTEQQTHILMSLDFIRERLDALKAA
jgi:hypothetical protein